MMKRGLNWDENLAYAIGLFVADGHLSIDGRHLNFTSKDLEQILNFKKALCLDNKIGKKGRGKSKTKKYYYTQFGSVKFYKFLQRIGVPQKKTYEISELNIPKNYFSDYLRGFLDGDGTIGCFSHPETEREQIRIAFYVYCKEHTRWLKDSIKIYVDVEGGHISNCNRVYKLTYCKRDSLKLIDFMYYPEVKVYLSRKAKTAKRILKDNIDFRPERWKNRFT